MISPFAILFVVVGSINLMIMSYYHRDNILFYKPFISSFSRIWLDSSVNLVSKNKNQLFEVFEQKRNCFKRFTNHSRTNRLVYFDTFFENKWWKELK